MQFSAECIILALPFEFNFQITRQKITSWEKWIYGGETPLTPIHSALDRERPCMDRDALPQPVQAAGGASRCILRWTSNPAPSKCDVRSYHAHAQIGHILVNI